MPDRIHHAFPFRDQREIQIGEERSFALRQRRREVLAFRRDDRRVTAAAQRVLQGTVGHDRGNLRFV